MLDARREDEFRLGRLPHALNILRFLELEHRLAELPSGADVAAYCRGFYLYLSFEAVALLSARGCAARRLKDGFPEWKAAGLPINISARLRQKPSLRAVEPLSLRQSSGKTS